MWEGERPVPVRLMLPLDIRDDTERIGAITLTAVSGARAASARSRRNPGRQRRGVESTREGNSRYSP